MAAQIGIRRNSLKDSRANHRSAALRSWRCHLTCAWSNNGNISLAAGSPEVAFWAAATVGVGEDATAAGEGQRADIAPVDVGSGGGGRVSGRSLDAIANGDRIGSSLKTDPFHSAPAWAELGDVAANGQECSITGGDGVSRTLVQSTATVNDISGRFELIVNPDGTVSHQLFVPGGTIKGVPIRP